MLKRDSFTIRKKILNFLKDKPMAFSELERKVRTNTRTIRKDCEELEYYKLISLQKQIHPSNGRPSTIVKLTKNGLDITKQ